MPAKLNTLRQLLKSPLVLAIYIPGAIFAFCQALLIPVLPLYILEFGVSYGLVGLITGGEGLGMLLGDIPAGILVRRFGTKKAMLAGVVCSALATGALFWTSSVFIALILRLISGFGVAQFNIARHSFLADRVVIGNRGKAIATFGGVTRIGGFAGPAIGGGIAAIFGLQSVFLLFSAVCLVALTMVAAFVQNDHTIPSATKSGHHFGELMTVLKTHYQTLIKASAGQLFAQMIRAGRTFIIPVFGGQILGLNVGEIGVIISTAGAVDMTLFPVAGYVMDRWGRKFSMVPSFFIQSIGMALIPFTGGFSSLLLATSLIGFGNGLGSGTMMTLGADLAPEESRSEFLGVWRLVGDLGHTGAPIVVGRVADLVGLSIGTFAMATAGLAAAAIFALLVPETLNRKAPVVQKQHG